MHAQCAGSRARVRSHLLAATPPSALLPAGTSGSPHARPPGRSPVVLCSSPPPPPPPSPQCGRFRRCRHPPLPCAGSGPARPGPAQGGGGSGSVRIAGRLGECSGVRGGRAGLAATSAPHSLGGATLLVPHVPAAARKGRRCVPSVAPPQLLAALPAPPVRGAALGLPARLCGRPEWQRGGEPAVGTCGGPCAERGGFVVGTGCPPVRYVGCWGCRAALG